MTFSPARLCLLFTPSLCVHGPWTTLREAVRGGVDLVQWRVKEPDLAAFLQCRDLCRELGVPLIVNDDVMLARRGRAQGAHVGQDDMPAAVARRLLDGGWLGVSTHDLDQIAAAVHDGADYVGFGPCFPTATKGYEQGLAPELVAAAVRACPLPLFAIGGVTAERVAGLRRLGVQRVAVSSAVLQANDPAAAAAGLAAGLA